MRVLEARAAGQRGEWVGCCEMWMWQMQHESAEVKCSVGEYAHVHAREGVGELGAVVVVVRVAAAADPRGVSAGSDARAMCGHTPRTFLPRPFLYWEE